MKRKRIRIAWRSARILQHLHNHVEMFDVRGGMDVFRDVASDACDGHFIRIEMDDLIARGLLKIVRHGFDDSCGRDPLRNSNPELCGVGWSVNTTKKLVRALWPDRVKL